MPAAPWLPIVVVLAAFGIRVVSVGFQSLWRDEMDVIVFASRSLPELLARLAGTGENGPLYYVLMHFWLPVAGRSELSLRFPSVLGGTVGVVATMMLGERLAGRRAGAVAGLLATLSPFLVWYGQDAKMYGAYFGVTALTFLAATLALGGGTARHWITWLLLTAAGLYLHLFSILATAALACSAPLLGAPGWLRSRWIWAVAAVAGVAYAPLLFWQLRVLTTPPPSAYSFLAADVLAASILYSLVPPDAVLTAATALTCGALGVVLTGQRRQTLALVVWLLVPPTIYLLVSLRFPVYTERYLIFLAVPFSILVGAGVAAVSRRTRLAALAAAGILSTSFLLTTMVETTTTIKSDFRSAARFVTAHAAPDDALVFVTPHVEATFRYYFGTGNRTVPTPYTNDGAEVQLVERELAAALDSARRVWLVLSEPGAHDARGLTAHWLGRHFRNADGASFVQVGVALYER